MVKDSSNRKNAFIEQLRLKKLQKESGIEPKKKLSPRGGVPFKKTLKFEPLANRNDPFLKKYDNPTEPSDCLQYDIQQRKHEIYKMKQQVDRGIHRDSINADDYKKIIQLREHNVEMNEYI